MTLAESIACYVRLFLATSLTDPSSFAAVTAPLRDVIGRLPESRFQELPPNSLRKLLVANLQSSEAFRRDLAEAIDWKMPVEDSAQLASLALMIALDKSWEPNASFLAQKFDWKAWRDKPDLGSMLRTFQESVEFRTGFARIAEAYPGVQNIDRVIETAIEHMQEQGTATDRVSLVLTRHLLNWDGLQSGGQELQFLRALQGDFTFRQAVAAATGYESEEAKDLASQACDMLRTMPKGTWIGMSRGDVIDQLQKEPRTKRLAEHLNPVRETPQAVDWQTVRRALTVQFSGDPDLASILWEKLNWPRPFSLVLREELKQIAARRLDGKPDLTHKAVDVSDLAAQMELTGVAFSGGGIRSATFNLGVLQKLAEFGLLKRVDYLSTVSGGGYIGAWLAGWIHREGIDVVEKGLSPKQTPDPRSPLRTPIEFLREYSNYLTPTLGIFSFDTWTMASVYTRNVLLNQATLVALIGTLLLIPRFLGWPMTTTAPRASSDMWMVIVAMVSLVVSIICMSLNMKHATAMADIENLSQAELDDRPRDPINGFYGPRDVQILAVTSVLVSVVFGSIWFWRIMGRAEQPVWPCSRWWALGLFVLLSALLALFGGFWSYFGRRYKPKLRLFLKLVITPGIVLCCSGGSFGLLLLYLKIMQRWKLHPDQGAWHAEIWGPVMLFTVLAIPGILQVGLMGADFPDSGREWLSRFRGICSIYAVYWIAVLSASIYGPLLVFWAVPHTKAWVSAVTAWVGTTIAGFLAGSSKKTGDRDQKPTINWLEIIAKVGPPVFMGGLLIVIATLESLLLAYLEGNFSHQSERVTLVEFFVCLAGVGLILAWRVDINEFSMHHFYKNRLVRCYLGASHTLRNANPFTGFDEADDLPLSRLKVIAENDRNPSDGTELKGRSPYQGPYPIINTTLNLSAGKQLAWQERKAASFILTPCFCGFDFPFTAAEEPLPVTSMKTDALKSCAYRPTIGYSQPYGPRLGTAVSISGAAASPNQGYNTSASVAFLMTMFDVRLGWWMGNPRRDWESTMSGPRFGLAALISELLGRTDDEARFVNLSDGGHFDNMGIYELVRRRCKFIVLCDAEQDQAYRFGGLGMAIRKCRVDFGATINIDPRRIVPVVETGHSDSHCAVGTIEYLDGSRGTLVYIKASLTGNEPEDVIEYHANQPEFPHESTAEQWFEEPQFESYRALGYHAADATLSPSDLWRPWNPGMDSVRPLFEGLEDYWYPINPNLRAGASKLTGRLAELLETVRANTGLHPLGAQLFPNAGFSSTGTSVAAEEFYFCMSLIQLVEDIYFEFELDRAEWFKDPRIGGWRYLFRTWKAVPALASVWATQRPTFREDFQRFWLERIG